MIFAKAIYLWGLLGLLLPIAIHMWSRKKVKTIKVGSTKLLEASKPKQTSSIALNELWLLLLRLLTVLLLVLILAEPKITTKKKSTAISYLVESSLLNDERMRSILDTIPQEAVRILKKGFPLWNESDNQITSETPLYWQLAQNLHRIPADSIVVFSKGLIHGLKGRRPKIKANTRWIVVPPDIKNTQVVDVVNKDSFYEILSVSSDNTRLSFKKDSVALNSDIIEFSPEKDSLRVSTSSSKKWATIQKNTPLQIGILKNDSLKNQVQFFRAAYSAISKFLNRPIVFNETNDLNAIENFDTFIAFDNTFKQDAETKIILYKPDRFADELITKGSTKNLYHLTRLLNSENIVNEHLPESLIGILKLHEEKENVLSSTDTRTIDEKLIQPLKSNAITIKNTASIIQLAPWLWWFLIVVVLLERALSKYRKQ